MATGLWMLVSAGTWSAALPTVPTAVFYAAVATTTVLWVFGVSRHVYEALRLGLAVLLLTTGGLYFLHGRLLPAEDHDQIFAITAAAVGLVWLGQFFRQQIAKKPEPTQARAHTTKTK